MSSGAGLLKNPKQLNGSTAAWTLVDKAKGMSKELLGQAGEGWGKKRVIRGGKQVKRGGK